ncbi:hypothetical protein [Pseudoroseomonas ludipueritiae]|uniref:Lipoprotein SmpA/OmlA domain-containing protein n=1 Tax=Pseudoroseomonas ludipueritiae TaxID=198093 RepID=A0ABR7R1S2_9PROT|nr:hypothetical protein [Pseudoroseomonas ludipueritiae]MBC9175674.1 hypothetical protein [Pseudoroseomonas ludipueritiae]MCG7360383.1 hypothetical protein [Roseomonas sp. ACRSG]
MPRLPLSAASVLLLVLSGCATRAGFESRLAPYVGRSEGELVAALGVPVRVYQAGSRRFLQYERRKVVGEALGGWGWAGGYNVQTYSCDVTFEVADNVVHGFTSRGNDCVAPEI